MAHFLLFGVLLVPLRVVEANFLSSLFVGDSAYAEGANSGKDAVKTEQHDSNSQNPELSLEARVSSASVLQNKQSKSDQKSTKKDSTTNTSNLIASASQSPNIVADNAIQPATGPMGVSDGTDAPSPSVNDTSVYVVRAGDSISQIADMFGVSVNTILTANNMKKGDKLTPGDVLLILPISGIEYTVKAKDSLQSIAKLYKVNINDIVQNNDIALNTPLVVGDTLIIPNAEVSQENDKPIPAKDLGASIAKDKQYYVEHPVQNLAGYFIDPVPGYRLSQGIHDKNAVDLAIAKGTPIHAAAAGVVLLARGGYNGGFGNVVIINHPNGTQTVYAHQSKLATHTGDQVYQGEVIGYVGSTGHSTGPHLHFEVHGAQNPGADDSWKY